MRRLRLSFAFFAICLAILAVFAVNKTQASVSKKIEMYPPSMTGFSATTTPIPNSQQTNAQILGGSDRYLTSISSDKQIYQVSEKVFIRGVMLNAVTRKPLPENNSLPATIQIKGPHGELVASGSSTTQNSVWAFEWQVPESLAGGEYSLSATYPGTGYTSAERKIDIRAYREPRLSTQITFLRDGYGPGDKMTATLSVKRAEGGFPDGAKVSVNANVDGTTLSAESGTVDAKGSCTISFNLPRKMSRGEGTLALTIHDGGVVETASKTIPILLQTVDIHMFPEGGDLIAGYENRVYVQVFQPNGKPADVVATIISDAKEKQVVAQFHTEHEGRGKFQFIPHTKAHYSLKILKPSGIKALFPLPPVKVQGAVIRTENNVFKRGQPITVKIGCTQKKFRIVVSKREQQLVSRNFDFNSSSNLKRNASELKSITLQIPGDADGVLIVTVSRENGIPLAERLIFREPAKPLLIQIKPDKNTYAPGDVVKLSIKTTDVENKPLASVVGVTVTDETMLKMMDKRDRSLRLPVMMYLEPEVKDLADASVYLDPKNPKAPLAIDLLLGTQGWRRFALVDVNKFLLENGDKGKRALAFTDATALSPLARFQAAFSAHHGAALGAPLIKGSSDVDANSARIIRAGRLMNPARLSVPRSETGVEQTEGERRRPSARWDFAPNIWKKETIPVPRGYNSEKNYLGLDPNYLSARKLTTSRRATNVFQIEPTVINERQLTWGRSARHRATSSYVPAHGDFVIVREFAHHVSDNKSNEPDRNDFGDTVYWNAGIKTDSNGAAEISFRLNDSITTFQTFADAFSNSGSLGDANAALKSIRAFYVEPKLPLEVSTGDRILLPVNLINGTSIRLDAVNLNATLPAIFKLMPFSKQTQHLKPNERARAILPVEVGFGHGAFDIVLNAAASSYHDKVVRPLQVAPGGFPVEKTFGGILEPGKKVSLKISIEKNMVPASVVSNVQLLPSPLAKLTAALERLIQDPHGCFEQTSSTSYPLTMAQQYFLTHTNVDPKLIESSRQKLDAGYQKLLSFRCKDLGYECFGHDPGHEALTAYGLLHFTEMAKVKDVDQNMIATTRTWLLNQKDGNGGFTRERRSGHSWLEDKDCSNAYILWALLESGEPATDLQRELAALKSTVAGSQNSYVVALAANAFALSGDNAQAKILMDRLAAQQKSDGSVNGITASIVGSSGESLRIEGTSLATLAWLRQPEYVGNVDKSIRFLTESCKDGRYSSTQATVLALRCIVDYDKQHSRLTAPGKVHLYADGHSIGDWIAFDSSSQDPIKLPDLSETLSAGDHEIELAMDEGSALPYTVGIKYNRLTPTSDKECKVDLKVTLAQSKLLEGKSTEATVILTNTTNTSIPTPIAIIGLPGGLEPRHDQLKELVKRGKIDAYEVRGREIVLYWRAMPSNTSFQIPLSLIAVVPGSYTGPASRAYLYYSDEYKKWTDGLHVEIAAN
jgi:hypothetical protein